MFIKNAPIFEYARVQRKKSVFENVIKKEKTYVSYCTLYCMYFTNFSVACTRSEILDYSNRVSKFGQEIADKKRPNSFVFEIWEFMQNAKRNSCKNDPVSTTNQLSTDDNASQQEQSSVNGNETHVLSDDEVNDDDDDDDDLFNW